MMRRVWHVTRMEGIRDVHKIVIRIPEEKRIILKYIWNKYYVCVWTGLIWVKIGSSCRHWWRKSGYFGYHKRRWLSYSCQRILAYQAELWSMELNSRHCNWKWANKVFSEVTVTLVKEWLLRRITIIGEWNSFRVAALLHELCDQTSHFSIISTYRPLV